MDPESTGYDNILFWLIFFGLTFAEAKDKVPEIAEFSGLGDYLHLPLRTYSTGMALRLAFSSGTSVSPDILILDEMIGAGDVTFREKSLRRIEKTLDAAKILVLASHDLLLLEMYCDSLIWLEKGRVKLTGKTSEVLTEYRALLEGGA
jgi:homopolymeric O-antigen transport system ATP-binding protein